MVNKSLIGIVVIAAITAAIIVSAIVTSDKTDVIMGVSDDSSAVATVAYPDRIYDNINTGNGSPLLGDPSAPITIIEFGDYQCHFCKIWHAQTLPLIKENYISDGSVNLIFVDYAFLGRDSPKAAHATHCAHEQDMYWEYHDILYNSQQNKIDGGWASAANLDRFATLINLDENEFENCMSSDKYNNRISYNKQVGSQHGVEATPAFFIVGPDGIQIPISGAQPYGTFVRVFNSMS